jgi:hypothetical protein
MTKHPTRYGAWAGNPAGFPADPLRCVTEVNDGYRFHQCTRKRGHGPDGAYCKQHDPDAIAAKKKARNDAWEAERQRRDLRHDIDRSVKLAIQLIADGHNNPRALAQWALAGGKGEQP